MRVLVTGSAGFIGFHVANRLLARGDQVLGIDNFSPYYDVGLKKNRIAALIERHGNDLTQLTCDIGDWDGLNDALAGHSFDAIVHLAAQAGVRHSIENPRAYLSSNLAGHLNILEIARAAKPRHLVYASSSSVYGRNETLPFSVDDRVDHPSSLYAATKKADELMSEAYAHLYRIPQTGLRFFTVYGPWGRPDMAMWLFTSAILEGRPIDVFGEGRMRRDFTYIDDVVAGIVAALDSPPINGDPTLPDASRAPHRVYNLGNHRSEDLERMIELIELSCGRAADRRMRPMQDGDVRETYADIAATERALGFRPRTSIDVGIPRFVEWYRNYHRI